MYICFASRKTPPPPPTPPPPTTSTNNTCACNRHMHSTIILTTYMRHVMASCDVRCIINSGYYNGLVGWGIFFLPPVASFLSILLCCLLTGKLGPPHHHHHHGLQGEEVKGFSKLPLSLSIYMFPKCSSKFPIIFLSLCFHTIVLLKSSPCCSH